MDVKMLPRLSFLYFFTIASFFFSNCNQKSKEVVPNYVIAKDTMVHLLAEIHLLESSLGIKIFEERKIINARNLVKSKIYKDYRISRERFVKSYNYYALNPMLIDSIYIDVISEITKRQAEMNKN
jgi:hypothetical protein